MLLPEVMREGIYSRGSATGRKKLEII